MICADSCKMRNVRRSVNEGMQCLQQTKNIKKQKVCSACVVLKLQETTAIGVAIQSGVTPWVPGRWPCCRRRSTCALGRSGGGSGGSRRRRGLAAKDLLQAGAASMRTCDPHSPPHTYPVQKTTLANKLSIGGQSHRNPPHANEYGGLSSRWPPPVFA